MFDVLKRHYQNNRLGHGYFLVGSKEGAEKAVLKTASLLLQTEAEELFRHPDFFRYQADKFGVDDSRNLKKQSFLSSRCSGPKVFFMTVGSFTPDAQNALLKLMEEPPADVYFFISASSPDALSLILRSRLAVLFERRGLDLEKEKMDFLEKFLKASPVQRLKLANFFSDDRARTIEFVKGLEAASVYFFSAQGGEKRKLRDFAEEARLNRRLLDHPALSCRLILEHLALTLPRLEK
ncbi:MAG: hypothetical protein UV22_C0022G0005 [Parcubacteria group bacterium GW2011_GWA2_42_35]|nr:MAG: hypothetical protein UV22_C0022G0005 [Parcubacteria group bacterium GW2011_GWA2_42_35]